MLTFLRKHQKILFIFITIVIVISFSFFGTYSARMSAGNGQKIKDTAFVAINGKKISSSELMRLYYFIATDNDDKRLYPSFWGPNFLNDGVIKKDFLKTGLAKMLYSAYSEHLAADIAAKNNSEKAFTPYSHPQMSFLGAANVWKTAAPEIVGNLEKLKNIEDNSSEEGFGLRVKLFLSEKKFSPRILQRYLMNQINRYEWIPQDPNMNIPALSLFNYTSTEDWFGRKFIEMIAQFIINTSIIAEQKGYSVSREEAFVDLIKNSQKSFKEQSNHPSFAVNSNSSYFQNQLQAMRFDEKEAVETWRRVMLFRRLFNDVGFSILENTLPYKQFNEYAGKTLDIDMYELPKSLILKSDHDLQRLETYLEAVSTEKNSTTLPTTFYDVDTLKKNSPELVQKRYLIKITEVDKVALQTKIGVKKTWDWELNEENWSLLTQEFPELKNAPLEERADALDKTSEEVKLKIDSFARMQIIDSHPEWIDEALEEVEPQEKTLNITYGGNKLYLDGIKNTIGFMNMLENSEKIEKYSEDQRYFYRIDVLKRSDDEILTLREAGTILDKMLNKKLEKFYEKMKIKPPPENFKNKDGEWKEFSKVRALVADRYFEKTKQTIYDNFAFISGESVDTKVNPNFYATHRLYNYIAELKEQVAKDPDSIDFTTEEADDSFDRKPLEDQWKLVKRKDTISRENGYISSLEETFKLKDSDWSSIVNKQNGELSFFQVKKIGYSEEKLPTIVLKAQKALAIDAKKALMSDIIKQLKEKSAISIK